MELSDHVYLRCYSEWEDIRDSIRENCDNDPVKEADFVKFLWGSEFKTLGSWNNIVIRNRFQDYVFRNIASEYRELESQKTESGEKENPELIGISELLDQVEEKIKSWCSRKRSEVNNKISNNVFEFLKGEL